MVNLVTLAQSVPVLDLIELIKVTYLIFASALNKIKTYAINSARRLVSSVKVTSEVCLVTHWTICRRLLHVEQVT